MATLFSGNELRNALDSTLRELITEVEQWDPDQMLGQSESEIAAYVADKYSVRCPTLLRDQMYADEPMDAKESVQGSQGTISIPSTRLSVHVPFEGEATFFSLRPDSFTVNPPTAVVGDAELILVVEGRELDAARVRQHIDGSLGEIERWLAWSREMADRHNLHLPNTALEAVRRRKQKLLKDRKTVADLGIPVRRRSDPPSYAIPVQRRRPDVAKRPTPTSVAYDPEPALSDDDYEEAIRIIANAGRQLERSPITTKQLSEEERRNLLLVNLNAQFEGQAGGEVFNGAGKTDILLRVDNRNVFVAECKIWRGAGSFRAAINQLLSYLVWRDTKAALVLFIESGNATAVIDKASRELRDHPQCVRSDDSADLGRRNYVLLAESDLAREIQVALLPLVISPDVDA